MNRPIKALGEVALRVHNLDTMQTFYEEVIGLELMSRAKTMAFFKIAPSYAGHTQVFALFNRTAEPDYTGLSAPKSTLDHLAFSIDLADFTAEKARLESLGLVVRTAKHAWVQWRSLYVTDPEGNTVELVCYDETIAQP